MARLRISKAEFLKDPQGKTFNDVVEDPAQPFEAVLEFFEDAQRQRRMEESEIHHDRPPMAGIVRELESLPEVDKFLSGVHRRRSMRLRQAKVLLGRMIMERRGWKKTGRKGSLGVRVARVEKTPAHNKGGLAFWFVRAERYEPENGMPFRSVRERYRELANAQELTTKRSKRTVKK